MRVSDEIYEQQTYHTVTAPEAAYVQLYGIFRPSRPDLWQNFLDNTTEWTVEEWLVEDMDFEIIDLAAKNPYHGRIVQFFTPKRGGSGMFLLPNTSLQYMSQRPHLEKPCFVSRGLGVHLWAPAYLSTDTIKVTWRYRMVKND